MHTSPLSQGNEAAKRLLKALGLPLRMEHSRSLGEGGQQYWEQQHKEHGVGVASEGRLEGS